VAHARLVDLHFDGPDIPDHFAAEKNFTGMDRSAHFSPARDDDVGRRLGISPYFSVDMQTACGADISSYYGFRGDDGGTTRLAMCPASAISDCHGTSLIF